MSSSFVNETAKIVEFTERVPASILKGSIFKRNMFYEPSELCDSGDYIQEIQIRVENKEGDIYLSLRPIERGEWWSGVISWEEFFDLLMRMVKNSNKFKYNDF